jgi:hypothetical protein
VTAPCVPPLLLALVASAAVSVTRDSRPTRTPAPTPGPLEQAEAA